MPWICQSEAFLALTHCPFTNFVIACNKPCLAAIDLADGIKDMPASTGMLKAGQRHLHSVAWLQYSSTLAQAGCCLSMRTQQMMMVQRALRLSGQKPMSHTSQLLQCLKRMNQQALSDAAWLECRHAMDTQRVLLE